MLHETSLIATIAIGLAFAFIGGFIAVKLHLPPLIGYLLAGIALGPFTPGIVADATIAPQLAEIGVILLMFGVGLHFSLRDLWAVRRLALPGALVQIIVATALGIFVAFSWNWTFGAGLVFGLALSVASTVVLLRALAAQKRTDSRVTSHDGRVAIGWLIVEDLIMILVLVLLPLIAGPLKDSGNTEIFTMHFWTKMSFTLGKIIAFVAFMLIFGTRLFPWLLKRVEKTESRELFTIAVIAIGLGVAFGSAELFGVSFALGAFFAGVVLNKSQLSERAAKDLQPLQDAFAALFFVAVGMLFDPMILVTHTVQVLIVVAIIVLGKSLAAFLIVLALRQPVHTALFVSATLAQIGEFSFILAGLGVSLGLLTQEAHSLILAGALLSITLNPFVISLASRLKPREA